MRPGTTLLLVCGLVALSTAAALVDEPRSEAYRQGQRAVERQDWEEASRIYAGLASKYGDETDAALYWKAYADWKRHQKNDALEGVARLLSAYPKSAWADDAKALQLEIKNGAGGARSTDADDEELRLYALDSLLQVEPEKAIPVLERILNNNSSERMKERALFVLSQSDSPRAREILLRTARSGQPPALRSEAVRTLGIAGEPEDIAALAEIARDPSAPPEIRDAVIEAYLIADRPDELAAIARSDPDPRLRAKAVEALGATGAVPTLRQLWNAEKSPEVRAKLLEALGVAGDVDTLTQAARAGDPQTRAKAIEGLGVAEGAEGRRALRQLYNEFRSAEDKRRVAESLMVQGDAKTLIELFRAEKDPAMKKVLVQQLSVMDDPEATRILMDILGEK